MKYLIILFSLFFSVSLSAESEFKKLYKERYSQTSKGNPQLATESHTEGAKKIAIDQDELSADVQEIIQGETNEKVIQFFAEAEELMHLSTDKLEALDTSGETIAIGTEIVEKIYGAAKEKQQSSGSGQQSALMKMMQQMMGKGDQSGSQPGRKPGGKSGGEGQEGDSHSANQPSNGNSKGSKEQRRLPRKSGSSGTVLPREFNKALDAYNKALSNSN